MIEKAKNTGVALLALVLVAFVLLLVISAFRGVGEGDSGVGDPPGGPAPGRVTNTQDGSE